VLGGAARVSAIVGLASFGALLTGTLPNLGAFADVAPPLLVGASFLFGIGRLALLQRHRDIEGEVWARVWTGAIGKSIFATARRLMGGIHSPVAMTHRATELALGMAAEQLFESLPKATRAALGDLPRLLRRLQDDAQAMRRRHDELQEALATAGDRAALPAWSDVRHARDEVHAKLGEAVGALEMVRLGLLRLHAGSLTVQGFTTNVGLAVEVSEQVERIIAAHGEVERSLVFPAPVATTPA
jgi:hypothetical protein